MKKPWAALFGSLGLWLACSMPNAMADTLDTEQRLQLLERRAQQITQLTLQLTALQRNQDQLHGRIELLLHQLAQSERKQRDRYQDLEQRLVDLAKKPASPKPPIILPNTPPPQSPAAPNAEQAYAAAWALLSQKQRKYPEAITALQTFIQQYPEHALVVNAHYWLGEAHFVLQNNPAALAAFTQVVKRYPDSAKVPDALYMIARVYQAQQDTATARTLWQRLLRDYPESRVITQAKKRLAETEPDAKPK